MIPALIAADRAIERRVSDQTQRQGAEQRQEKRLRHPRDKQQGINPRGLGRHQRHQSVADPQQQRGGGQQRSPLPHPVDNQSGGRLHEKHTQAGQRNGHPQCLLRPLSPFEIIAQKRHHDAGDFGQKEIRSVQPHAALPRNILYRGAPRRSAVSGHPADSLRRVRIVLRNFRDMGGLPAIRIEGNRSSRRPARQKPP